MPVLRLTAFVLGLALVGCGSKGATTDNTPGDAKPGASGKLTLDNTNRIVREQMTLNHVKQMFAGEGEATSEEKPGLMPGSGKYVWQEDGKKVYVSFGHDGKANGVAWEGFGGR